MKDNALVVMALLCVFVFFGIGAMQRRAVTDIYAAIKRDDKEAIDRFIAAGQAHLAEHVQMCVPGGEPEEAREVAGQEYELHGVGVTDTRLAMTPLYFALEKKKIAVVRKLVMGAGARLDAGKWVVRQGGWHSRPAVEFSSAAVALARCAAKHTDAYTLLHDVVVRGTPLLSGYARVDDELCNRLFDYEDHEVLLEVVRRHIIGSEQLTARLDQMIVFRDHRVLLEAIKQHSIDNAQLLAKRDELVGLKDPSILLEAISQHYITPDQLFASALWGRKDYYDYFLPVLMQGARAQGVSLECQCADDELCKKVLDAERTVLQEMVNQHIIHPSQWTCVFQNCAHCFMLLEGQQKWEDRRPRDYSQVQPPDDALYERMFENLAHRRWPFAGEDFILLLKCGRRGDLEKIFTVVTMQTGLEQFVKYLLANCSPNPSLVHRVMPHVQDRVVERLLLDYLISVESDVSDYGKKSDVTCESVKVSMLQPEPSAPPVPVGKVLPVGDKCPVCGELLISGGYVRTLPCGHNFHGECVGKWLAENHTCPMCRSVVP